jgi:hypothetical protein
MREKDYNTGLRGVLFEARHYKRMGAALWLYGWLVLRQTHQQGGTGWVLGGSPVTYREIEEETGFNHRTLERWMRTLRQHGYIETDAAQGGVIVRITKAKKFKRFPQLPQGVRRVAESVRRVARGTPQRCADYTHETQTEHQLAEPIGSSSVDGYVEKTPSEEIHRTLHRIAKDKALEKAFQSFPSNPNLHTPQSQNPSGLGSNSANQLQTSTQSQSETIYETRQENSSTQPGRRTTDEERRFWAEIRRERQLLRQQRDEEVRRELAVGTGPEVHRS